MINPVLFVVFSRPDTTARVFEAIRQARPPRLYVAADGPRASRPGEAQLCEETRRIASAVDWPCELKTLFRPENLGCKAAVSGAIDWFFDNEEQGVILEDDCLPDASFFEYCDALLEKHKDDLRVMCISGDNFMPAEVRQEIKDSYYFSIMGLGRRCVSSDMRVPSPPARMTAFMPHAPFQQDAATPPTILASGLIRFNQHWRAAPDKP